MTNMSFVNVLQAQNHLIYDSFKLLDIKNVLLISFETLYQPKWKKVNNP